MGEKHIEELASDEQLRQFMKSLLQDVRALETMLGDGMIEEGIRRIGAEQELALVDNRFEPAPRSHEILEALSDDDHYTTELGKFNIEFNLDPVEFGGKCLAKIHEQIDELLARLRAVGDSKGIDAVLTGILPTLRKSDMGLHNMTDLPRYAALNDAMTKLRGGPYELRIMGTDELNLQHQTVMLEACNTSFQVHFQVGAEEFAKLYNLAQTVSGPVLAAATNSPLLFGKRLWRETRIALFLQSLDTRRSSTHMRELSPRVSFGNRWVEESVLEIFREDITRFRVLIGAEESEDPFDALRAGIPPRLRALQLHNSTVYRWNRPCYGILGGKAHLRIENRYLPAGPTPADEVANAALWFGIMSALSHERIDIREKIDFDDVRTNFVAASRLGLDANFTWLGRITVPATDLLLQEIIPRAREGLELSHIDTADIDRYLGIIEERVRSGQTGSRWMLRSLSGLKRSSASKSDRLASITASMVSQEKSGKPVHAWEDAAIGTTGIPSRFKKVEEIMTTDLFTVTENELIDLVANVMDWQHIRHVPVEDSQHRLVGLVSHRSLLRVLGRGMLEGRNKTLPVSEIMQRDILTVDPEDSTRKAIDLMRSHRIACLPVVKDDRLVGIVTERDFLELAASILEDRLGEE